LIAAAKRKADEISQEEESKNQGKRRHKSLKDDPRPFATPALRKKKEKELAETPNIQINPNQIHPSIIAQPSINKEKAIEKELRDKERAESSNSSSSKQVEINPDSDIELIDVEEDNLNASNSTEHEPTTQNTSHSNSTKNGKGNATLAKLLDDKTNTNKPSEKKSTRIPKKVQMLTEGEEYDILKDLNQMKCNISVAQLANVAPKIRSQLSHGLRLEKNQTKISGAVDNICTTTVIVNNIDHSYVSKSREPQEDDIAMVDMKVDGVKGKALIDSCSNLSIITKQFLDKLPHEYEPIGISAGRIRLATTNEDYSEDIVIQIPITINKFKMLVNCRVVDKDDPFYDVLINLKTQIDYQLFIHPLLYSLCQIDSRGLVKEIAPINNDYDECEEEKLLCVVKAMNRQEAKQELKQIEGLSPFEYIHNDHFLKTLSQEFRDDLIKILEEYIKIVATSSEQLTPSDLPPHKIRLKPGTKPIKQKYYRLSKLKTDILKGELAKLIEKELIEPSYSEWSSPIVIVPKPNGKYRLCIDYRKVNDATEKDSYPLPNITEIFDSLDGATVFTTLDLYSGYHQILMDEESIEVTSFTTKFGNYQFKVMPFGLTGAPATFQREMNRILFPLIGKCVFNFIDDILIYSKTEEEHLEHVRQVFDILNQHKLKVNIEKCTFMQPEVEVLGHKVSAEGLSPLDNKIKAIKEWKPPTTVHELRSFLGAIGYYRDFIDEYAKISLLYATY